jgi:hypothetical protein
VIVTVVDAVPNVTPAELRSVIVTVAVPLLSARVRQDTAVVPPAATVPADCVELVGLVRRSASVGVKLKTTDVPVAADAPLFVTVAVAVNDWPRPMVAGTPLSVIAIPDGAAPAGVKLRDAEKLPRTPAEVLARTRHQCWTAVNPVTVVCDAVEVRLSTSGALKALLSSTWIS